MDDDRQKLRIKLGDLEFEAEGPADVVKEQLEAFRSMVASLPSGGVSRSGTDEQEAPGDNGDLEADHPAATTLDTEALARYFDTDRRRRIVTLKVHPRGAMREANAVLLLLYGFRRLLNEEDVLVGRVKDALEQSGIGTRRVDRAVAPHLKSNLILKGGRQGPGGKYRLTNPGIAEAERQIRELS